MLVLVSRLQEFGGNRTIAPAIDTNRANQLSDLKTCSEHNDDGDDDDENMLVMSSVGKKGRKTTGLQRG